MRQRGGMNRVEGEKFVFEERKKQSAARLFDGNRNGVPAKRRRKSRKKS